ncbi:dihydroorotate dehydrogenase-like protein [Oscillochloris sp. ZM17-4]|uniref:dihydroorotate dehydrogenase-like protein n=1 Tax=Oscillochloris sp. ZM17-4 TaxID=2866714 RepID=UPI001C73B789|nr:dihydroorotate dehydrogenase-like protein [Oscillochloris sp. ZM17-4]MBX0328638.1 dihydroorotate dehydrogenase-like protein [Oscillochloris sp. ZM17-4]
MIDLSTSYLGMPLKTPIVASASPLSHHPDVIQRLEEAGASAVVMYSLFEEQIIRSSLELDYLLTHGAESFAEALNYLPDHGKYNVGPERYIEQIHELKRKVHIPVIGSLNGVSPGGWIHYARLIEEAGADALELNIYNIPTDPNITGADLEQGYVDLVRNVRAEIKIPLAIKLSPYFSSLPNLAWRLMEAGAQGLVLFNRFYQPDFDLESLEVVPNLQLSTSNDLRLPLRWVALLYGRVPVDLALTSGVHTANDVLKAMMAGAKVAMMASALLKGKPDEVVRAMLMELQTWMTEHEYESITQMQGSMAQRAVAEPSTYERANYMKVLGSYQDAGPTIPDVTLQAGMLYPVD